METLADIKKKAQDDAWLRARELDVREGLRREAETGYPGRCVYGR